jgi:7-cyano-7-deazaguanine synthase
MSERQAVVLLSGGLDSSTVLAIAKSEGFECNALSFRYGQRHKVELDCQSFLGGSPAIQRHLIAENPPDGPGRRSVR